MSALVRFRSSTGPEIGSLERGFVTPSGLGDYAWAEVVEQWANDGFVLSAVGRPVPVDEVALLPPLTEMSRVFCVAQNYPAHAAEAGGASPPRPIVFLKPPSAFVGHRAAARLPRSSTFFDYEGELAVVIGRPAQAVEAVDAADVIAGFTLANDGSARDLQPATLADRFQVDWFAAKSFDQGSALGPAVCRATESPAPETFRLRTRHNGELVQDDVAGSMFHSIPDLIAFVSRIVGLRPGDVILSGTPAGVGKARGVALGAGDTVTVGIAELGELTTRYVAPEPSGWDAVPDLVDQAAN
jgi:2-keto-4-pentenoate hydratase/2-oxohepta-3-ene-1,7-dioic acid hydratase in catechol pathway